MNKVLNIATVFSGIGAPEQALHKLGVKHEIVFACDNGEIEIKKMWMKLNPRFQILSQKM